MLKKSQRTALRVLLTLVFLLGALHTADAFADACRDAVKADEEVFAAACTITAVREPSATVWRNYRLKGVMVDFTDPVERLPH